MFTSSMHSLQSMAWQTKHIPIKNTWHRSYTWQEQQHGMYGSLATTSAKSLNMSTICQDSRYSKSRARFSHARVLHNCKQRHGWIEHNNISKSSLLNMLKRGMDHSIATWIHGIKILSGQWLRRILSPWISNITRATLHACASHHIDHKNTWQTPL